MKILIMCEGPNELKIINLLLDNGKLKFTRDDLLDMRPFHARQLTSPQLKPALDAYHGEIAIYRIGDKMTDSLKIPKELLLSIKSQAKFCTKPELEMLLIIAENKVRLSILRVSRTFGTKVLSFRAYQNFQGDKILRRRPSLR